MLSQKFKITRKDRLKELKQREGAFFDLKFLRAMPETHRSQLIDLLETSRSQIRQDLFVLSQTGFQRDGFFVEFGATDGVSFSNSWLLETAFGWNGILSEPGRGWHKSLHENRKCRIDTRCVWKESDTSIDFVEAARGINSGISSFVPRYRKIKGKSYSVPTVSLDDLLDAHDAPDVIDYLSVDTEGSEYEILSAFDFDRRKVRILTVEHNFAPQREKIYALLSRQGYRRLLEDVSRFDDWYVLD